MDFNMIQDYLVVVIVGICICVGYIIKTAIPAIPNRFIPLIMAILGVILNVWITMSFSPEVLLGGMISGLASTGTHQAFTKLMEGKS